MAYTAEENKPVPPEQQEWVDWVNGHLAKRSWKPIKNLTSSLKSGVVLNKLLEVTLSFLFFFCFIWPINLTFSSSSLRSPLIIRYCLHKRWRT